MRWVVVLLLLVASGSLAGCTQGDPGKGDSFDGTCPSWIKGLSTNVFQEGFQNGSVPQQKDDPQHPTGAGLEAFQGHPLDLIDLDFHPTRSGQGQAIGIANGTLELRVLRASNEELLLIHDLSGGPGGEAKDVWTWGAGIYRNFTLQVSLADPGFEPNPGPVRLRWDFIPDADAKSPSEAVMLYTAYFWYRTCSSDGRQV